MTDRNAANGAAKAMTIWVVTDGRAGNENQALGLAEAIAKNVRVQIIVKSARLAGPWNKLHFPLTPRNAFDHLDAASDAFPTGEGPDLWIGCGRQSVMLTIAAKRRYQKAFRVQILSPGAPLSNFDLVIAPAHDGLTGDNVISIIGAPNRLTDELLTKAAADFAPSFSAVPTPRIALLIGGPNKRYAFGETDQAQLLGVVDDILASGAGVMATASRRTPSALVEKLSRKLRETPHLFYDCETPGVRNPYPAMLGACDFVLATADSVNMISEAASGPAPVFVLALDRETKRDTKFDQWMNALVERECVRFFDGKFEHWPRKRLDETARVAQETLIAVDRSRSR
jgi:mitochondrial fission protein ELM1